MPKVDWKSCDVCGEPFNGAEYLQLEVESSGQVDGLKPRKMLVSMDVDGDEVRSHLSRNWRCGDWMTTKAVCLPCVNTTLPAEWRPLFRRPSINDWIPIERLDSGDGPTETWKVRKQ